MGLDNIDFELEGMDIEIDFELEDIGLYRLREEVCESLYPLSARKLAYYFSKGSDGERIAYGDYLKTKSEAFKVEFREHLDDPFLGEREGDDL